ncbi:MAG: sugar ABC transporter permease [Oscillospiraceae bacterium]|nr:sugar ABC transporter permease [Oscillospiraceae bacterium]
MKRQRKTNILFLFPSMTGVLCFFVFPLCYCLLFSFSRTFGRFQFAWFDNYISLFRSETFRLALWNTCLLLIIYLAALYLLAIGTVYLLNRSNRTIAFLCVISISMFLPPALITNCVQELPILQNIAPPVMFGLIYLWKHIGINALILKSAQNMMPKEWSEAAVIDGANKWRAFLAMDMPYLMPHLKFLYIFNIICFFRMFRESYLLYGLYPPDSVYLIQNFFFNNFQNLNYQRLSIGAVLVIVMLLVLHGIVFRKGTKHEMV